MAVEQRLVEAEAALTKAIEKRNEAQALLDDPIGIWKPEVLADVGGFAGLCAVPAGLHEPILVSGTDGVGTKLKVAFAADRHDTIGRDLVPQIQPMQPKAI